MRHFLKSDEKTRLFPIITVDAPAFEFVEGVTLFPWGCDGLIKNSKEFFFSLHNRSPASYPWRMSCSLRPAIVSCSCKKRFSSIPALINNSVKDSGIPFGSSFLMLEKYSLKYPTNR